MTSRDHRPRARACLALALVVTVLAISACTAASSESGAGPRGIATLDARTGRVRWSVPITDRDQGFDTVGLGPGLVVTSGSVCGEGGSRPTPHLDAYDGRTGERRWVAAGYGAVATKTMAWQQFPTVDVAADGVVVATGGRLTEPIPGLDARTGKRRWRIGDTARLLGVSDAFVFATHTDVQPVGPLEAYDRRAGSLRWSFSPPPSDRAWGTLFDVVAADATSVVVANGHYNEGASGTPGYPTVIFVLDAATGHERTRFVAPDPAVLFGGFAIAGSLLVYADGPNAVGRDLRDGAIRWTHPTDERISVSADGGTVFTNGSQGITDVLDATTGALRWTSPPGRFFAAADRSRALVTTIDRDLVSLDARTGAEQWRRPIARVLRSPRGFEFGVDLQGTSAVVRMRCDPD